MTGAPYACDAPLRPVTGTSLARTMSVVTRAEGYRPPAADELVRLLPAVLRELGPADLRLTVPVG
ncbi:hypothetical protein ACFFWC_24930 [Plantactinospora siamensis]|uniref:Uncharacterized protein n=1 Tax=Plantactinospora siamensis TaxID=555372 RepID=A0ABV6NW80_9ACTN